MIDYLVGGFLVLLVILAVLTILRSRKHKKKCEGCPYKGGCSGPF